ncbi:hypothetical protein [Lysobacter sp. cf310]|uniref:hypothetical protein n=1 Tax=Lysobacter sp. cf310 TaxID=1761790 RepID=UPI000B815EEC|nr:hypothetical protein [Lysobacter sp. cf310]
MTDDDIRQLLGDHRIVGLPDVVMEREFALGLVASGDPEFLLKVPEPWRTGIIEFGKTLKGEWYEISNNGVIDYSSHASALKKLVTKYLEQAQGSASEA